MHANLARLGSIKRLAALRQPPLVYVVLVTLTGAQLAAFLVSGTVSRVSTGGSALMLVLLLALGLRSRFAWALLVLMNAVQLFAVLVALLPGTGNGSDNLLWSHIAVSLLTGVLLEATLLSPAMRQFVWSQDGEGDQLDRSRWRPSVRKPIP
ncbi:MAG: hypothetical protein M0T77_04700 [Actinomycetota bacterium]|nr:hypothetical protein [Actinomycetota bacterium]